MQISIYCLITISQYWRSSSHILYYFVSFLLGTFGGGQIVTISGAGFDSSVRVTICDKLCENLSVNSSYIVCVAPSASKYTKYWPCSTMCHYLTVILLTSSTFHRCICHYLYDFLKSKVALSLLFSSNRSANRILNGYWYTGNLLYKTCNDSFGGFP